MAELDIDLRRASRDDAPALARFARSSFAETYAPSHDAARIRIHCDTVLSDASFEAAIAAAECSFLLAWRGGTLVGFAQVLPCAAPVPATRPIELKRFYVAASEHGRGLAQTLFDAVLACARANGADLLWLCVYPGNARAQRFYARQGLEPIGHVPYRFVDLVENDLALGLKLDAATGHCGEPPLYSPPSR